LAARRMTVRGLLGRSVVVAAWAVLAMATVVPAGAQGREAALAEARSMLETDRAEAAIQVLDSLLKENKKDAEALLLRSSAHFELGDFDDGRKDLDRSLELDPLLRQGWLNRAGLAMAEGRNEDALAALLEAQRLDPAAPDNDLNIGAVRLILGELDEASNDFQRYLETRSTEARAYYLVATNYGMNGYAGLALQYLQRAVSLDERSRLRARTDPNLLAFETHPRFEGLFQTDTYRPPPGAHQEARALPGAYQAGDGPLLPATLDALYILSQRFEPGVEVTPKWALIWGDMRVKLRDGETPGEGVVELSAAAERYSAAQWQQRSKAFLDTIYVQLQRRTKRR